MKIGFLIRTAPIAYQNLDTVYALAKECLNQGHGCAIFLFEDAVTAASKDMACAGERNMAEMLQELADLGVIIKACGACAQFRGYKRSSLIPGVHVAGLAALAKMVAESDRFITLGY